MSVLEACSGPNGGLFFVYKCGRTRKTFIWKTLITKMRTERRIVPTVVSSGITALLLPGGHIAHSRFKIPLNLHEGSSCPISQQSQLSKLIQKLELIIWDEAPMMHRHAFEAMDRTFRDVMKFKFQNSSEVVFGGRTVVLGGDFRQILPVVKKGGREVIALSGLQRSSIWSHNMYGISQLGKQRQHTNKHIINSSNSNIMHH